MYKISREELKKYLLEKISDEATLKKLDELIEQALKELKFSEITAQNIDEIYDYIIKKYQDVINTKVEKKSGFSLSDLIIALAIGGGGYGVYHHFSDHRYSVEQEYALISTCVGYQGFYKTKERCIEKLQQCYKEGLKIQDCKMY